MTTDTNKRGTGSGLPPGKTARDFALRGNEVDRDAKPRDLLRAPEGELRRFAKVAQPGKGKLRPGLRPKFAREW